MANGVLNLTPQFLCGTDFMVWLEDNCEKCRRYNYENPDKSCEVEIKLQMGNDLTEDEAVEYFGGKIDANTKCKMKNKPKTKRAKKEYASGGLF